MSRACSSCGAANPDEARFCSACGAALDQTVAPRLERKLATALFADIVGSTALAEREDPEVVRSLVARTFDALRPHVERHGGTLEAFLGDGLLAVFGIPAAHEDDPERAVRAALEMQATVSELNEAFAREGRPALAIRIGVEAGEVLADLGRAAGPRDRMLTGDAVNTAARLQASAQPGRVVVGPAAHAATSEAVEYEPLPPLTLKGKSEPVTAWLAVAARPDRAGRPSGLRARLVGRDEELALLTQAFHRVASEGRPALVTVLGTAGVGKSRLVAEFIAALEAAGEPFRLARGRCRSYGNVSYSALADAVKSQCGIREDDPPEAVAAKTAAAAEELFGDASLAPGLESLVAAVPGPALAREDLFDAWRRFLEALATGGPLVLALEDIHWADEGLLDFLDHAADWAEGPLLLLAAARPELLELRPTWGGGKRNYAAIYLDPLSPGETGAMVEDLLEAPAPADLLRFVVERSEGNPLFGEEIVRVLIERGAIRRVDGEWAAEADLAAVEMPRSVKAVLASRIDALPPEEKAVVQDAAVVGREFWPGAVELLSRRSRAEVLAILHRLRAKELVVRREPATFSGEDEFLFRHALIRDVAYESLPKSFRADKHIAVARWAQEQAAERRDELAEMLATHHSEALRYLRELGESPPADLEREAFRWARAAGDRSLRLWQQREAARWLRAAAELAEAIGLPTPERAAAWEAHALAAEEVEPYPRVAESLERALALYDEAALVADAGRVQARLAWTAYLSGREDDVLPLSERAIERLEPLGDGADLATALHVLGWYLFRRVRYEEAERHLRRAIAMAERVGNDVVRGHATISLAFVYQQTQRGRECVEAFEAALDLARRAGDLSLLLRAQLHICGGLEEVLGDDRRGERLAREGLDLARRTGNVGNVGWMAIMLSDMLFDLGRLEEAGVTARESLEASRAVGERLPVGYALERLAVLHALRLELDEAESLVPEIRQIVRAEPEPWLQGWAVLIDGLLAFGRGDLEAAADRLAEGTLPIVDRMFVYGGASVLLECVRALVRVGRAEEAKPFRDRLAWLAVYSVPARAFLGCAEGLLSRSPEPIRGAVAGLEEIGWELELGRALLDLAAMTSDPEAAARGRGLLERCGAPLFLRDGPPA